MARFGNDDGYLIGPPAEVFSTLERLQERLKMRCCLDLQRDKTEIFARGDLPEGTPADLKRAGTMIEGVFEPGFDCYGVGIGSPNFVSQYLEKKVDEIEELVNKTCQLLEGDLQAKWTLLTASVTHKFGYSLSLQYPSDIRRAAGRLDDIIWGMLQSATGLVIPRREDGRGFTCVLGVPVRGMARRWQTAGGSCRKRPEIAAGTWERSWRESWPTQ